MQSQREVYLDGSNFSDQLFDLDKKNHIINFCDFQRPSQQIEQLVSALKNCNYSLKVFIKSENVSKDKKEKWMVKREKEVQFESIETVPKIAYLLWGLFTENKVQVFFNCEASFHDTIASNAQLSKAIVLTNSQKLFKYQNRHFQIFEGYQITKNGSITFIPFKNPVNPKVNKIISSVPAKILTKNMLSFILQQNELMMGCPTMFVRRFGNPYITLRPLRQAAYACLGIKEMIEILPFWDHNDQKVKWNFNVVQPDAKFDNLLDSPFQAIEQLYVISKLMKPQECPLNQWNNYLFGLNILVFEICCLAKDECEKKIFELMKTAGKNYMELKKEDSQIFNEKKKMDETFQYKTENKNDKKPKNIRVLNDQICKPLNENKKIIEIPPEYKNGNKQKNVVLQNEKSENVEIAKITTSKNKKEKKMKPQNLEPKNYEDDSKVITLINSQNNEREKISEIEYVKLPKSKRDPKPNKIKTEEKKNVEFQIDEDTKKEQRKEQRKERKRKKQELKLNSTNQKEQKEERKREELNLNIISKICSTCNQKFEIKHGEANFFQKNGLSLPNRCKECRASNKKGQLLLEFHWDEKGKLQMEKVLHLSSEEEESPTQKICHACNKTFEISFRETRFYEERGFNLPNRCRECRKKRKEREKLEDKKWRNGDEGKSPKMLHKNKEPKKGNDTMIMDYNSNL